MFKYLITSILLSLFCFRGASQHYFFIAFTEKEDQQYWSDNTDLFLSQESIARKLKFNTPIEEQDFPVTTRFIDTVKSKGYSVLYATKWLNGVIVSSNNQNVNIELVDQPFIESMIPIGSKGFSGLKKSKFSTTQQTSSVAVPDQFQLNNFDVAYENGLSGSNVKVAVFDAGFPGVDDWGQSEINVGYNLVANSKLVFTGNDHGTNVLSIIQANKSDYKGIATNVSSYLYITEDVSNEYPLEEYNWLKAAEMADSIGVDIISSSLGYFDFDEAKYDHTYDDFGTGNTVISKAAQIASDKNILVVNSAGNEGNSYWNYVAFPADVEDLLSVASVDANGSVSSFSSHTFGDIQTPNIASLGRATNYLNGFGNVVSGNGTSYAAPIITGFAALLMELNPDSSAQAIKKMVLKSGSNSSSFINDYGYGVPSFNFFFGKPEEGITVMNPVNEQFKFFFNKELSEEMELTLLDIQGKVVFIRSEQFSGGEFSFINSYDLTPGIYHLQVKGGHYIEKYKVFIID